MEHKKEIPNIEVQDLDHLGIIAGIIDDIQLVTIINQILGEHPPDKISSGHAVKALILNCMGFLTAPLYLFHQFFVGKATQHLIGKEILPSHLNARRIGRVLDKLYRYGITTIFMTIALEVVKKFGVSMTSVHGDSSSFYVHGEYESEQTQDEADFTPIQIKRGYSRDHRQDLKQFTLNLLTSTDGDIPLGLRVGDGNEVDTQVLVPFMKQWRESWEKLDGETPQVMAGDAALFTEDNLEIFADLPWISRVPARIGEAVKLMQTLNSEQLESFEHSNLKNYRFCEVCTIYGNIPQRWIIVESQCRLNADLKKLEQKIAQHRKNQNRILEQLKNKEFACETDALTAARAFEKKLKFHLLVQVKIEAKAHYQKRGRPSKQEVPSNYSYHIQGQLKLNQKIVDAHENQAGRFIVATNILDSQKWKPEKVVIEYKDQTCERGFRCLGARSLASYADAGSHRFLKDPLFFVSRVYLKSPKRITVLMMIMGLALLVYSIGQREVRQMLANTEQTLENQKGKQTQKPTLRWLLQCYLSVHLVWIDGVKGLIKLNDRQRQILKFLSPNCQKYYLLS